MDVDFTKKIERERMSLIPYLKEVREKEETTSWQSTMKYYEAWDLQQEEKRAK